jgi:hypothetical protein
MGGEEALALRRIADTGPSAEVVAWCRATRLHRKHSGRAALRHILSLNGIAADEAILQRFIRHLHDGAPDRKRPLHGLELRSLYESAR